MTERRVVVQQINGKIDMHEMLHAGTILLQRIHQGTLIPDLLRESCMIAQIDQSLLTASDRFLLSCHKDAEKQVLGTIKTPELQELHMKLYPEIRERLWETTRDNIEICTLRLVGLIGAVS